MRVVHVIVSLYDGGAQAVLFNLLTHDPSHKHYVISLSPEGKYSTPIEDLGIEVQHLDMPLGRMTLSGVWKMFKLIKDVKPDVVQTWMYHSDLLGGLMARFAGVRNVVWGIHHSTLDKRGTARNTRIVVKLLTVLSRFIPKKIISCSNKALNVHVDAGYKADKLEFVGNGYDLERFQPDNNALDKLDLNLPASMFEEKTVFATVARWNPQKDHYNLIDACQHLLTQSAPPYISLLIGPNMDHDNKELVQYIKDRQLEDIVLLCGSTRNVPAIMNAIDFHVLPSSFGEAFPNVVAEAMSCSTPCVVTDVGDAAAMVDDTGWVVPPRDSLALATAIRSAMDERSNAAVWQNRKAQCRKRALGTFDIHRMIKAYESVWKA